MPEILRTNPDVIAESAISGLHAKLEVIEGLDLRPQIKTAEEQWPTPELVAAAAREFKHFLALPLLFPKPRYPFTPSLPVDALWHAFIIDTRRYREFCHLVYGAYLDHVPRESGDRKPPVDPGLDAYKYTLDCLRRAFVDVNEEVWTDAAALCGPCFIFHR
jgi:hypothetical protein